uniref:THAP-type domain-containing protein n=1 Tax=Cyprinodon variegatus TaxID=28743 RepID=A0A3Q2E0K7_CYPVA
MSQNHRRNCSVPGCTEKGENLSLPKDLKIRQAWIIFVYQKILAKFGAQLFICSKHFTEDSFENLGRAVPTLKPCFSLIELLLPKM